MDIIKSDYQLYSDIFWKILKYVSEDTKEEYDFFYEKFLNHLIMDTKNLLKNYSSTNVNLQDLYKIEIFKRTYVIHTSGGNNKYFDQLLHPERDTKLRSKAKRIKRKNKMQKIIEIYGN